MLSIIKATAEKLSLWHDYHICSSCVRTVVVKIHLLQACWLQLSSLLDSRCEGLVHQVVYFILKKQGDYFNMVPYPITHIPSNTVCTTLQKLNFIWVIFNFVTIVCLASKKESFFKHLKFIFLCFYKKKVTVLCYFEKGRTKLQVGEDYLGAASLFLVTLLLKLKCSTLEC